MAIAAVGLLALLQLDSATHRFARVANDNIARLNHIDAVSVSLAQLRALELEHLITQDQTRRDRLVRDMSLYQSTLQGNLAAYESMVNGTPRMMSMPLLDQRYAMYVAAHARMMALTQLGQRDDAIALFDQTEDIYRSLLSDTASVRQQEAMEAQGAAQQGFAAGVRSRDILVGGLLVAVVLIFGLGVWFSGYVSRRIDSLLTNIRHVARGDFTHEVEADGNDEFTILARSFNAMTSNLKESEEENQRLYAESLMLKEERISLLQDAFARSVDVQENERHRIARELHDQVGQSLAMLQLVLSRLQKQAPTPETAQELSGVREMALQALKEVRQVSLDLRPGMLDDAGLFSTLREYAQTISERSNLAIEVAVSGPDERLQPELEVTVFRIVQEAMTNIVKHARAKRVRIALTRSERSLDVSVQDDGTGFDLEQAMQGQRRRSLGLFGMEERCRLSGGRLRIESHPGEGTRVTCGWEIPMAPAIVAAEV